MIAKRISPKRNRVTFLMPSRSREGQVYFTHWDFRDNTKFCTCPGFFYRGDCRHVLEALASLTRNELKELTNTEFDIEDWVPTSLEAINSLTSIPDREDVARGLPLGLPIGFYGFHESLKTGVGTQLAVDSAIYQDKPSLIEDTEGATARFSVPFWARVLSKRYEKKVGVTELIFKDGVMQEKRVRLKGDYTIYTCRVSKVTKLLRQHGVDVMYKTSNPSDDKKQSKIILDLKHFSMDVEDTAIGQFVEENDVGMILYDSVSMPFKGPFIGSQQNQPSRAAATDAWFTQIQDLAELYDLAVIGTIHASGNPQKFRGTPGSMERPNPLGGTALLHNFKLVLYFQSIDSMKNRSVKKIWIERSPFRDSWDGSDMRTVKMTDAGVIDSSDDD